MLMGVTQILSRFGPAHANSQSRARATASHLVQGSDSLNRGRLLIPHAPCPSQLGVAHSCRNLPPPPGARYLTYRTGGPTQPAPEWTVPSHVLPIVLPDYGEFSRPIVSTLPYDNLFDIFDMICHSPSSLTSTQSSNWGDYLIGCPPARTDLRRSPDDLLLISPYTDCGLRNYQIGLQRYYRAQPVREEDSCRSYAWVFIFQVPFWEW